jgi:hypothetical protein
MKTHFEVNLNIMSVECRFRATIEFLTNESFKVVDLHYRGPYSKGLIFSSDLLLNESTYQEAEEKIKAQIKESEINNRRVNLFCQSTKQGLN